MVIAFGLLPLAMTSWAAMDVEKAIEGRITAHLQEQLNKEAQQRGWLSPRLTYKRMDLPPRPAAAPCDHPLHLSRLDEGTALLQRQRLEIACDAPTAWRAVSLVTPSVLLPVLVASQVSERGQTLRASQLRLEEHAIDKLKRGFYQSADEVIGQTTKRRIRDAQVLTPALVAPALLVHRGQQVKVIAEHADIHASTLGMALEDGRLGQQIRVRNLASDKVINARVKSKGTVTSQPR